MSNPTTQPRARSFWSNRFAARTGPVWQRLGPIHEISERMTAHEALDMHGVLANYVERPTFYQDPSSGDFLPDGNKAILRSTRGGEFQHMASVDRKFEVVQPADIAAMLDTPFNGGQSLTERWPVDLVGVRGKNAGFFITLNAGGYDVRGDGMQRFFMIKNGNDGGTALEIGVIHIRLKCWNTMTAALKSSFVRVTIPHRANAHEMLGMYTSLIAKLEMAQTSVQQAITKLADTHITDDQARAVIEKTFQLPAAPQSVRAYGALQNAGVDISQHDRAHFDKAVHVFENKLAHAARAREAVMERYQAFNDQDGAVNGTSGTAWSIFNAVTEVLDNMGGKGETDDARDNTALETLFGHRARARNEAFNAAYEYVRVR